MGWRVTLGDLDRGAKFVLQNFPEDLLRVAFPGVEPGEPIGTEVVSAQVLSDRAFVGQGPDGEVVLHVEFEAEPTSDVGHRVSRTACGLYFATGVPVLTTIVYMHAAADRRRPKAIYRLPVGARHVELTFNALVLWEDLVATQVVAEARPGLLPFAGLAKGARLETIRAAVSAIAELAYPKDLRADLLNALYLLSGHHFTSKELIAMISEEALMQSKTYQATAEKFLKQGREEAREEGRIAQRRILVGCFSVLLGRPAEWVRAQIDEAPAQALDELAALIESAPGREALKAEFERLTSPHDQTP